MIPHSSITIYRYINKQIKRKLFHHIDKLFLFHTRRAMWSGPPSFIGKIYSAFICFCLSSCKDPQDPGHSPSEQKSLQQRHVIITFLQSLLYQIHMKILYFYYISSRLQIQLTIVGTPQAHSSWFSYM